MTEPLPARLARLAQRGPHADPRLVVARAHSIAHHAPIAQVGTPPRRPTGRIVAAVVMAAAVVTGIGILTTRDRAADTPSSNPSTETTAPATTTHTTLPVTLPPANDLSPVPMTVAAGSPLSYWRFLPDVDIAERQTSSGSTELCWRTTAGQGCLDDTFQSPNVGIVPVAGGAIMLARPGLELIEPAPTDPGAPKYKAGPEPTTITVRLSDGTEQAVTIEHADTFGVGYSRLNVSPGVTIIDASSS